MSASVAVPAWWLDGCRHREVNHSMSCGLSHEPGCVPSCPVATSYAAYAQVELDGTQRTVLRLLAERDDLRGQLAEAHRTADRLRDVNQAAREELAIVTGERDAKQGELAVLRVSHAALFNRLAAHRCPRRGKRARAVIRTAIVHGRHIIAGTFRYADCTTHEAACVAIAKSVDARKARGR